MLNFSMCTWMHCSRWPGGLDPCHHSVSCIASMMAITLCSSVVLVNENSEVPLSMVADILIHLESLFFFFAESTTSRNHSESKPTKELQLDANSAKLGECPS